MIILFAGIAGILGFIAARARRPWLGLSRRVRTAIVVLALASVGLVLGVEFDTARSDDKTGMLLVAIVFVAIIIVETAMHIYEEVTGARHIVRAGQARQPRPVNAKNLRQPQ
jgi:hypothetical protein